MEKPTIPVNDLLITNTEKHHLNVIRKWTSFFSILGLVGIILMIISSVSILFLVPKAQAINQPHMKNQIFLFVFYLVYGLIYLVPIIYLYRASNDLKTALFSNNQHALTNGFRFMGKHFRFIGILVVILLIAIPVVLTLSLFLMQGDFPIFPSA